MPPTIRDIAKRAGLSVPTVSQILNDKGDLYRPETRRRVIAAAERLGYRPNLVGRALRSGKTMTIGYITGSLQVAITTAKLHGAVEIAREQGYLTCIAAHSPDSDRTLRDEVEAMTDRRVDGMIIHAGYPVAADLIQLLDDRKIPAVLVDGYNPAVSYCVSVDRDAGIRAAVRHIAELGHRQAVAFLTPSDVYLPDLKARLYQKAFHDFGITVHEQDRPVLDVTVDPKESAYQWVRQAMQRSTPPTVLFMNNDDCAHAAIAAIIDSGFRVPQDVSVVGFDDLPHTSFLRPALTTIHQPRSEVGRAAIDMLMRRMQQYDEPVEPVTLPSSLIVRDTTAKRRGE